MSKSVLIDLHFLPSLEYFCALMNFEEVWLEKHEHFVKQSYRNRCYINTTQGVAHITVPLTGKHSKVPVHEIRIDPGRAWQGQIWRTIESAYRKAPFYEHYADALRKALFSGKTNLFDFNLEMLSFCLSSLNWPQKLQVTDHYQEKGEFQGVDLRSVITIKSPSQERNFYRPVTYYQVFGQSFNSNLTLVDLIFCAGPRAGSILQNSRVPD